jgi:hypothetical protein
MPFTRGKRIALELLGPPAIGAVLMIALMAGFTVVLAIEKGDTLHRLKELAQGAVFFVVFAYMFAGAQSILYACIMEWQYARGLDPCSWRAVALSSGLGLASGAAIMLVIGWRGDLHAQWLWVLYGGVGLLVGLLLGLLIRRLSR